VLLVTTEKRLAKVQSSKDLSKKQILLLGPWCNSSKGSLPVIAYHWDDRTKLYEDYQLSDDLYERLLPQIAAAFNQLHQVSYPVRYWRIVIGPWLTWWSQILMDRFLSVQAASQSSRVTEFIGAEANDKSPRDMTHYAQIFLTDEYNEIIYTDIAKFFGFPIVSSETVTFQKELPPKVMSFVRKFLTEIAAQIPPAYQPVRIISDYLKPFESIRLQLALKQIPTLNKDSVPLNIHPIDQTQRNFLAEQLKDLGDSVFEKLLCKLLPNYIPKVHIEGYEELRNAVAKFYASDPKVILTSNGYMYDEGFKLWAAEETSRGAKLVITQHGGFYGAGLFQGLEDHELKIADRYFSWGWNSTKSKKVAPLPTPQLARLRGRLRAKKKGNVLWLGMTSPRYSYRYLSLPVGPAFKYYLEDQFSFGNSLSNEVARQTIFRPNPPDYGWNLQSKFINELPQIHFYRGKKTFLEHARDARIVVGTYNATTLLETFSANFPTLLFWNPNLSELRSEAKQHFDALIEAKVLWHDPRAAANHLNQIFNDPLDWWWTPQVQKTIKSFNRVYGRADKQWHQDWAAELGRLAETT
jgi:putative transferase (TIGR04331 family)